MAKGITKNSAPSTHSVSEPGPACAAAAIQRVPTMQLIANRVRSRSPSSGFSLACSSTRGFAPQLEADAPQSFRQKFRLSAEPDPYKALYPQMRAGNDQHALVHSDALAELD